MKYFLVKLLFFAFPLIALAVFTSIFYSTEKGDVIRMGYIINLFPDYTDTFLTASDNKIYYDRILESPKDTNYTVMTIGDSFSDRGSVGYNNYLGKNDGIKLLHFDNILSGNPIQDLSSLINGDFFQQKKIDFVVLECVQRNMIPNIENFKGQKVTTNSEVVSLVQKWWNKTKVKHDESLFDPEFHSNRIIRFPYYTARYFLSNTCLFNGQVYKTRLLDTMFSVNNRDLIFLNEDVLAAKHVSATDGVARLNSVLNNISDRLNRIGIKLIVLPAPDKYDLYYEYIEDKTGFPEPAFFKQLGKMDKKYIYIDSKKVLLGAIHSTKDVYLYDDTHWSPWAAKFIAMAIEEKMSANLE